MRRFPPGQGHGGMDVSHRERRVEMREEITTTRFFPAQVGAESFRRDREKDEPFSSIKMAPGRLAQLMGRRKMDVAVLPVDRRTGKLAVCQGHFPFFAVANFVDCRHRSSFATRAINHPFPPGNGTNRSQGDGSRRNSRYWTNAAN